MHEEPITYRGTVYPWHCDHMGHMNVMWYVGKFDGAVWNVFALLGLTPAYLRGRQRGMAAVEQTIRYQRELHAGDVVAVRSAVTELRDKSLRLRHTMLDAIDGTVVATTELVGVHLDVVTRKAVPFEPEIAERLRASLAVCEPGRP